MKKLKKFSSMKMSEYNGMYVQLKRDVKLNNGMLYSKGAKGVITSNIYGGGCEISFDKCQHCGAGGFMRIKSKKDMDRLLEMAIQEQTNGGNENEKL